MKRLLFLTVLCTGIAMFLAGPVCAKVTGVCVNCHTMHNSQNGSHMMFNTTIDGTSGGPEGGGYPSLTRGSCVGCHTGTNPGPRPFVYDTDAVSYAPGAGGILAGGNFKWVADVSDAKGHNVKGVPGITADDNLTAGGAPGDAGAIGMCSTSCHQTLFTPELVVGTELNTGCEGCHLAPKHHAPQQTPQTAPALEANGWFRFLSGHQTTGEGKGVEGIEDIDWQSTVSATDHNEYLGHVNENSDGGFGAIGGNTMTAYCTGCHGKFHTQSDANANWIRHPSDAVLPTTGEYASYTSYDPIAPVARLSVTSGVSGSVGGTDMVMCLSCHRAHGSPYDDLLRWDYGGMIAGGGGDTGGCFVCHTAKDD